MISAVRRLIGASRRGGTATARRTAQTAVTNQRTSALIPTGRATATSSPAATAAASAARGSAMEMTTATMDQTSTRLSDAVSGTL